MASRLFTLSDAEREDILSDHDLIELRSDLELEVEECHACDGEGEDANGVECTECEDGEALEPSAREDIEAINELEDQTPDWGHGASFINERYFVTYAKEFASDIGAIDDDTRWPADCIDWEQAATELQMDYTSVEIGETSFYTR